MGKSVVNYLKRVSEEEYQASTTLSEDASKLVISVPVENNEKIHLKFYENIDGHPILILNMPETFSGGKAQKYHLWLMNFLKWKYCDDDQMPNPRVCDFKGHQFGDWQPNDSYFISVYSWDKKIPNGTTINRMILGLD